MVVVVVVVNEEMSRMYPHVLYLPRRSAESTQWDSTSTLGPDFLDSALLWPSHTNMGGSCGSVDTAHRCELRPHDSSL